MPWPPGSAWAPSSRRSQSLFDAKSKAFSSIFHRFSSMFLGFWHVLAMLSGDLQEPTITPTTEQVKEFGLKKPFGSPNGAMRGWNGITISRDTIHIPGTPTKLRAYYSA